MADCPKPDHYGGNKIPDSHLRKFLPPPPKPGESEVERFIREEL